MVVNFESINTIVPLNWCKALGEINEQRFSYMCQGVGDFAPQKLPEAVVRVK